MTIEVPKCPKCGARLVPGGLAAVCPACLLELGTISPEGEEPVPGAGSGGVPAVRHFGEYELLEEIARGGMGVVYRARQVRLRRTVALKMIGAGALASREAVNRFHTEATAAARLEHPNIVPIHEIGEHEGRHFYSMKLVPGGSLAELLRRGPFAPRRAASLMARVARAVAHAHERGVLHRDLKPGNILCDEQGEPQVTDFGLAQLAGEGAGLTATRAVLGSPAYMPPEQAAGRMSEVTTAADVYGLGAVLYELLTGRAPFEGPNPVAVLARVVGEEPVRPRAIDPGLDRDLEVIVLKCLEKVPARRYRSAAEVAEELERWLGGVPILARPTGVAERVGKWAVRRPAVAGLVVALAGLLVAGIAGIAWQWEKAREAMGRAEQSARDARSAASPVRSASRVSGPVSPGLWTLLARGPRLVLGPLRATDPEGLAAWEMDSGKKVHEFPGLEGTVIRAALGRSGERLVTLTAVLPPVWRPRARTGNALHEMHDGLVFGVGKSGATGEVMEIWETRTGRRVGTIATGPGRSPVAVLAMDADGRRVASGHRDGQVHLWDVATGAHQRALTPHRTAVQWVEFSRDDTRLVSCPAGWIESGPTTQVRHDPVLARVHQVEDGREVGVLKNRVGWWRSLGKDARALRARATFNATADRLGVWSAQAGNTGLWDIAEDRWVSASDDARAEVLAMAFSDDDRWLAVGSREGGVRLLDGRSGRLRDLLNGHRRAVETVEFGPDNGLLLTGSDDFDFRVWDVESGLCLSVLRGHEGGRPNAAFLDSREVVSTTADGTIRSWEAVTSEQAAPRLTGHSQRITGLRFAPDGRRLVSSSDDGSARIWEVPAGRVVHEVRGAPGLALEVAQAVAGPWRDLNVPGTGGWFVVNSEEYAVDLVSALAPWGTPSRQDYRPVRLWDFASGGLVRALDVGPRGAGVVVLSPDGGTMAVLEGDLERVARVTGRGRCWSKELRPPAGGAGPGFRIYDTRDGSLRARLEGFSFRYMERAAFHPDGNRFVVLHPEELRVYDLGKTALDPGAGAGSAGSRLAGTNLVPPNRVVPVIGDAGEYTGVRFSRTGRLMAVRRGETVVEVLETTEWRTVARFEFAGDSVGAFWLRGADGGEELLTWTAAAALVRHEVATGIEKARYGGFRTEYWNYALSGDERVFAVGQNERQVVALEVESGRVLARLEGHLTRLSAVALRADGEWLATGDAEGLIRLWRLGTNGVVGRSPRGTRAGRGG